MVVCCVLCLCCIVLCFDVALTSVSSAWSNTLPFKLMEGLIDVNCQTTLVLNLQVSTKTGYSPQLDISANCRVSGVITINDQSTFLNSYTMTVATGVPGLSF